MGDLCWEERCGGRGAIWSRLNLQLMVRPGPVLSLSWPLFLPVSHEGVEEKRKENNVRLFNSCILKDSLETWKPYVNS